MLICAIMETRSTSGEIAGNFARYIIVLCSLLALNAVADFIVDLDSAKDFMFLDINGNPSGDALIGKGIFNGDIGWSGAAGTKIKLWKQSTLNGDIYRRADSSLKLKGGFLGVDNTVPSMQSFIDDVDAAVAQFGYFDQDIDLGSIDQTGGLTIDRTDAYTVVDMDSLKLSSGTLTLNGQAGDVFYIRISNVFDLFNVDVNVVGTDSSRVFFIYDGTSDLRFDGGDFIGNIIAPNAAVLLSKIDHFDGSVISGDGFSVAGRRKDTTFEHTVAIPEPAASVLIGLSTGGLLFLRRIFRNKKANFEA